MNWSPGRIDCKSNPSRIVKPAEILQPSYKLIHGANSVLRLVVHATSASVGGSPASLSPQVFVVSCVDAVLKTDATVRDFDRIVELESEARQSGVKVNTVEARERFDRCSAKAKRSMYGTLDLVLYSLAATACLLPARSDRAASRAKSLKRSTVSKGCLTDVA